MLATTTAWQNPLTSLTSEEYSRHVYDFVCWCVGKTRRTRAYVALPRLETGGDFEHWDMCLRASLGPLYDIHVGAEAPAKEPKNKDSQEWRDWKQDRHDVFDLIMASIQLSDLADRMDEADWRMEVMNPRHTYEMVYKVLGSGQGGGKGGQSG
jgi:hypothetical protein